jgi:hypothetical protein
MLNMLSNWWVTNENPSARTPNAQELADIRGLIAEVRDVKIYRQSS